MTSNRIVQLVALGIALACLLANGLFLIPKLEGQRDELQLGFARSADEAVPASVSFASTMLGPARIFAINGLWYEVEKLKQEGKFAQINEMSRWIVHLQPRYPEVWRFMAWNLAYNVSVQCYSPTERWDWVNKGIRLLREEGLRYNPRAVRLYRELSWIFYHKMGQYSDDVHWYYKTRLCREWQELLGAYSQGWTQEQVADWFRVIVDAPDELESKALEDGTKVVGLLESNPRVREILDALLKAKQPYDIESGDADAKKAQRERMLRAFGKVLMYNYAPRLRELSFTLREQPEYYDSAVVKLLLDPDLREPIGALLAHLRKRVLIDNYNMQPTDILELVELFGPIDLRHPAAHGMFWGQLGIRAMTDTKSKDKIDYINTLRQRIHTMQDFTDTGRIFYDPYADVPDSPRRPLVLTSDIRFIEAYKKAVAFAEETLSEAEQSDDQPYKTGYENFLKKAALYCLYAGRDEASRRYYNEAKERFAKEPHNVRSGYYDRSYEENVIEEMRETMENMEEAQNFVLFKMSDAFNSLVLGYIEEYETKIRWARVAYDTYQKSIVKTGVSPEQPRMGMPPFKEMLAASVFNAMLGQTLQLPLEFRIRMWRDLPLELKQAVFDKIQPRLYQEATDAGFDPKRVFPEPEGMAEYRRLNPVKPPSNPGETKPPSPLKP